MRCDARYRSTKSILEGDKRSLQLFAVSSRCEGLHESKKNIDTASSGIISRFVQCFTMQEKLKPNEVSAKETKTTTTVNNKAKRTVLFQIAKAVAVNDVNCKAAHFRIILKTGSQSIYNTSQLKSKLNLSTVKSETLHL